MPVYSSEQLPTCVEGIPQRWSAGAKIVRGCSGASVATMARPVVGGWFPSTPKMEELFSKVRDGPDAEDTA